MAAPSGGLAASLRGCEAAARGGVRQPRLGSIRLLHALWEEFAAAAAPEGEQDAQQQGGWRKALAALGGSVMNAAVGACMYDAVGKVRLAATRLLLAVAPHLPPEEVLKVALVKARER